jgi:hypothetical protein
MKWISALAAFAFSLAPAFAATPDSPSQTIFRPIKILNENVSVRVDLMKSQQLWAQPGSSEGSRLPIFSDSLREDGSSTLYNFTELFEMGDQLYALGLDQQGAGGDLFVHMIWMGMAESTQPDGNLLRTLVPIVSGGMWGGIAAAAWTAGAMEHGHFGAAVTLSLGLCMTARALINGVRQFTRECESSPYIFTAHSLVMGSEGTRFRVKEITRDTDGKITDVIVLQKAAGKFGEASLAGLLKEIECRRALATGA